MEDTYDFRSIFFVIYSSEALSWFSFDPVISVFISESK